MIIILEKVVPSVAVLSLIGIILYFLKNPEAVDKWSCLLNRFIFWSKETRERRLISSTLDYKISSAAKRINNEAEGILPFGIRIKWRTPEEVMSYVQKNQVIVVLRKSDDLDKNIVEACMAYIPKALLHRSRNIVDQGLLDSIDHYVTQKILSSGEYDSAYNFFVKNILDDRMTDSTSFARHYASVGKIDAIGFFTRVLLEEFRRLGEQLYGTLEEINYRDETKRFLGFLRQLASRKPGDDTTPLFFTGKRIKVGIILFARYETLTYRGIDAYLKRIQTDYNRGANRIFLFSYAQRVDKIVHDDQGFVVDVRRRTNFKSLEQIERECKKLDFLRLLKKEKYHTRDVTGKFRSAKYYVYECIR